MVCGKPVVEAVYASAWERARKRLPCCSAACAGTFDPDVHWIPAALPEPATGDEAVRLRTMARQRLSAGDHASPVVRELLCAGLAPDVLRALVAESRSATAASQGRDRWRFVAALLHGRVRAMEGDGRAAGTYATADADLDRWERMIAVRRARSRA